VKKYSVGDIESEDWVNFKLIGFYDGKDYARFEDLDEFLDFFLSYRYRSKPCYFHNLTFDGQFLLDRLVKPKFSDYKITPIIKGSRIIQISIVKNNNSWYIRDSYAILPSSLKSLTYSFDVEHKKMEIDDLSEMIDNPEYNKFDCLGLYEVLEKYMATLGNQLGLTTASTAMQAFRHKYLKKPIVKSDWCEPTIRKSYYGGRVEIFRFNLDPERKFYLYDVNSLYPSVMAENLFPTGSMKMVSPGDIDKEGITYARVRDYQLYPLLPITVDKKMMFFDDKKEGWYTNVELRYLRGLHSNDITVEPIKSIVTDRADYIFKDYVLDLYAKRQEAKAAGNKVMDLTCKLLLNSLYGKFGQRMDHTKIHINPKDIRGLVPFGNSENIFFSEERSRASYILPVISAYVTAYARVKMHKYFRACGRHIERLYYSDTDSLIVDKPMFKSSSKLGDLKLEDEFTNFFVFLPKLYTYVSEGKRKVKSKGINPDFDTFTDYVHGLTVYNTRGIQTFKQSLKSGGGLLHKRKLSRSMRTYYDKRRIDSVDTGITTSFRQDSDRFVNEHMYGMIRDQMLETIDAYAKLQ
jgi:hypothetical protein